MADRRHEGDVVKQAIASAFAGLDRVLLAVSGGVDSMVMLYAAARLPKAKRPELLVASFDHATGLAAKRAIDLVRRTSRELDVPFVARRADSFATSEHEWRLRRWAFLHDAADKFGGLVPTPH